MMKEAIEKAGVLIEALGYIQSFRNRIVVIKLGGAAMDGLDELTAVLSDVVFMEAVGMRPVLVHGGGPAISRAMKERHKEPVFVSGRRVTDDETMDIVQSVLEGVINREIVDKIRSLGGRAQGIHSGNNVCVYARRLVMKDENGRPCDLGRVGEVTRVDTHNIRDFCEARIVPVVAPVGTDEGGDGVYNINADSVAGDVAAALHCEKIVYMTDTHGIFANPDDPSTLASHLSETEINDLVARGIISKGMLPKVEGCLKAIHAGVRKAHIIDGRILHSLLLEIFTARGIGTEIVVT
jgi:acetylglutamate kinase